MRITAKKLNAGDKVIILDSLLKRLDIKIHTITSIWETGPGFPGEFTCYIDDDINSYNANELYPLDSWPMFSYSLSPGERIVLSDFINTNQEYFKTLGTKATLGRAKQDGEIEDFLYLDFNFENLQDFFELGIEIGKHVKSEDARIKELDKLFFDDERARNNEQAKSNKEWNEWQDECLSRNYDENYDENGLRKDDEYNPNNWEGHDD